jgi:hypothetical protein
MRRAAIKRGAFGVFGFCVGKAFPPRPPTA